MQREEKEPSTWIDVLRLRQEKLGVYNMLIGRNTKDKGYGGWGRGFRVTVEILLFIPKKGFKQKNDR